MSDSGGAGLRASRVIVLRDHRILFVPIPKSGCTSVKWQLARLAGLRPEQFRMSRAKDVTRSLAIHDMDLWGAAHRWSDLPEAEQAAILADDSWLRFAVVRDPAARLWSAWQSKLLLAEPRFHGRFADEPWFPHRIGSVDDVVDGFRAFVRALARDDPPQDNHWAPQRPMLEGYALTFIGRAEQPDETQAWLCDHVGGDADFLAPLRENRSLLPYSPTVYDAASAEVVNAVFADDFAAFQYDAVAPASSVDATWRDEAGNALAAIGEMRARHERIGDLVELARESDATIARLRRQLERSAAREKETQRLLRSLEGSG